MLRATRHLLVVVLLCATARGGAQEPEVSVPFSCDAGAVSIDISRQPGVRFEAIQPPSRSTPKVAREFSFATGPIRGARIYLSVTLPEIHVGLASEARLSVLAETWESAGEFAPSSWWQLVPAPDGPYGATSTSRSLLIDANAARGCFGGERCQFADLAAAGDGTPLLVLGFNRDLGGANASNRELARLVLDFRTAIPRVALAADCAYNEGGGACTAFDSAEMPRSQLSCPWSSSAQDFLCSEESDRLGHRDFELFSGRASRGRDGEVATLEDAATRLASGAPGPIVVTGLSPVRLVHEAALGRGRVLVFSAANQFYVAERTRTGVGTMTQVVPRTPVDDPPLDRDMSIYEVPPTGWTSTLPLVHQASEISRGRSWLVLRIAEVANYYSEPTDTRALYWLGVERRTDGLRAEALTLVGAGVYAGCGRAIMASQVSAELRIRRPFDAAVTMQPPTVESLGGEVVWRGAENGDEMRECRRPGRIRWLDGEFDVEVSDQDCVTAEEPLSLKLTPDGAIRATPRQR